MRSANSRSLEIQDPEFQRPIRRRAYAVAWRRQCLMCFACGLVFMLGSRSWAQVGRIEAQRMGLEIAWQAQVQMPPAGRGIVSSHLWADATQMHQFAVVELPDRVIRVSAEQLDRKGLPIGLAKAKELASAQAQRLMPGKPMEVVEVSVPQLDLVMVTSDGLVQNFDAETGRLLWATGCGRLGAPTHPAAVSPAGISVVQGVELFLLDWKTGIKLMTKPLRHGTSNAIAACNDIAVVCDFHSQVEAYGLGRPLLPWSYQLFGHAVGRPVTTSDQAFTAIATDKGYAYVFAGGESPKLWLRYEMRSPILGSISTANNAFYVANDAGVLGKITVEDRFGKIEWEFASGKPIIKPSLVVDGSVYAATEVGDLLAIDDQTGESKWLLPAARVDTPLAVLDGHVVSVTHAGQLESVDTTTGKVRAITGSMPLDAPIINSLTDRLYLVTKTGAIQCLRPVGHELPTLHMPTPTPEATEEKPAEATETTTPADSSPFEGFGGEAAGGDPFGGGGDPFGGAGGDPFGGGAGGNAGTDPFGGDPFGGP